LSPSQATTIKCPTEIGPRDRPGPSPRANRKIQMHTSRGGGTPPLVESNKFEFHTVVTHGTSMCSAGTLSPPPCGLPHKAKYLFYISGGGPPRGGGRRRGQSTAVWLKRPTENFTSVSPFEGPMNIFSSAPPLKAETHGPPEKFLERSASNGRGTKSQKEKWP